MVHFKALEFIGEALQGIGVIFLTVQLWGPAWALEKVLRLKDPTGPWCHLVRDGFLLVVLGLLLHLAGEFF